MSSCTPKFWMFKWNTLENHATFVSYNCVNCRRYWQEEFRIVPGPVCILNSYIPSQCGAKFGFQDPVIHLPMTDNYASPRVYDIRQLFNQTFEDPSGYPNTNAHSVPGPFTLALNFDGVDDRITIANADYSQWCNIDQDFTIVILAKGNSIGSTANLRILSNSDWNVNGFFVAYVNNIYRVRILFYANGSPHATYHDFAGPIDGNWHQFAISRFNNTVSLYMDAILGTSDTDPLNNAPAFNSTYPLYLAFRPSFNTYTPCDLADFRFYNRALTIDELETLLP